MVRYVPPVGGVSQTHLLTLLLSFYAFFFLFLVSYLFIRITHIHLLRIVFIIIGSLT